MKRRKQAVGYTAPEGDCFGLIFGESTHDKRGNN